MMLPTSISGRLVRQVDPFGCGVACVAMVTGASYDQVRATYDGLGLANHPRRKSRPYASNFKEVCAALRAHGRTGIVRRWTDWSAFSGLGILKVVPVGYRQGQSYHWVVAESHPVYEHVILDPESNVPGLRRSPDGAPHRPIDWLLPWGSWISIAPMEKALTQHPLPAPPAQLELFL